MKNKLMFSMTIKSRISIVIILLIVLMSAMSSPVNATCGPETGGVITCDSEDDTVTVPDTTVDGGTSTTTVNAGGGNDLVTGSSANGDNTTVENTINGEVGNDRIAGGSVHGDYAEVTNIIDGGTGNDHITAGNVWGFSSDMTNTLIGGDGDDIINGGSSFGGDSTASNTIAGGEGNDVIRPGGDRGTTNIVDGGNGIDTVDYRGFLTGVTVDLGLSTPQHTGTEGSTDTLSNIENISGSSHNDVLTGTSGNNVMNGGSGDDIIAGEGGKDTISGGDGADTIILSGELGVNNAPGSHDPANAATVNGGSGANTVQFLANTYGNIFIATSSESDTLDFSQYNAPITIDLSSSSAQKVAVILGGSSEEVEELPSNELWVTLSGLFRNVIGSLNFNNFIIGNSLDNTLTGGNQDDQLNGGAGSNTLNGGNGIDTDTAATPVPGGVINQSGIWNSVELPIALPEVTETPEVTESPEVTETPEVTESPEVTETPVVTETPPDNSDNGPVVNPGVGGPGLIPVTGGLQKLSCGENTFVLPNGDIVTINGICGNYWISLDVDTSNLLGGLPDGKSIISGITIQIFGGEDLNNLTLADPLPQGAQISIDFLLHEQKSGLSSLYQGGAGTWEDLPGVVSGNYFEVSVNRNGTVVLVK